MLSARAENSFLFVINDKNIIEIGTAISMMIDSEEEEEEEDVVL